MDSAITIVPSGKLFRVSYMGQLAECNWEEMLGLVASISIPLALTFSSDSRVVVRRPCLAFLQNEPARETPVVHPVPGPLDPMELENCTAFDRVAGTYDFDPTKPFKAWAEAGTGEHGLGRPSHESHSQHVSIDSGTDTNRHRYAIDDGDPNKAGDVHEGRVDHSSHLSQPESNVPEKPESSRADGLGRPSHVEDGLGRPSHKPTAPLKPASPMRIEPIGSAHIRDDKSLHWAKCEQQVYDYVVRYGSATPGDIAEGLTKETGESVLAAHVGYAVRASTRMAKDGSYVCLLASDADEGAA